ncbi:MAG: hypothetical protein CMI79_02435 [Candidatus Pelagibacter sp.]|nr:hypothetical protein [Candidatus Pelagibacter sp.]|tara:strand:+ start:5253 stop:6155 length:903 start_codon:yes stop_codon:yes gene_type:complete
MIKNTKELFRNLKIKEDILSSSQKKKLDQDGFVIFQKCGYMLKNLRSLNEEANRLIKSENDKGGWEGKEKHYKPGKKFEEGADRLGALVNKHDVFLGLITIPEILAAAHHVLKSDLKIAGVNLRNPQKGFGEQRIHIDGNPRFSTKEKFTGVVCFCFLDDTTIKNGAIRIVPKSHRIPGYPDEYIDINKENKYEKRVLVNAGTIIVANLNIWHAGAKNYSGDPRKMIMVNVKSRDQDQLLNYKKFLDKIVLEKLTPEQSYLLATRKSDPTQKMDSGGSANQMYREFLQKRKKIELKKFQL